MTGPASRMWKLGDLDLTRPHGIQRPAVLPEDDQLTDLAAWLAAQFDAMSHDIESHQPTGEPV